MTTANKHPHAETTYRILLLEDGAYGVEVVAPESSPTRVTRFSAEVAAQEWIADHQRKSTAVGRYVPEVGGEPTAVKSDQAMLEPGEGVTPGRSTEEKTGRMNPTEVPAAGDMRGDGHKRHTETGRQILIQKAQAKREVYDKRSRDIAEARQKQLEIDAVKTARLRALRLAKQADNQAATPSPPKPAPPRPARTR
jgi:hypothetical protein